MTKYTPSYEIGKEICDILDLDVHFTRDIVIEIKADSIVTINVTQLLNVEQAEGIVKMLKTKKFLMVQETEKE